MIFAVMSISIINKNLYIMEENKKTFNDEEVKVDDTTIVEPNNDTDAQESKQVEEEEQHGQTPEERIAELEAKVEQLQKDALYRAAEFDNFRKRTIQEKADLIKYGSQKAIEALLPVIDDLERAMQHIDKAEDVDSVKEGVTLIMQKFQGYLKQQQVTVIPANPGDDFDDKIHEAITMFPAPDPSLKGKIVDCPTKGYKLYDKVVRYAKVVVGQ